jgi:hypothetical protein
MYTPAFHTALIDSRIEDLRGSRGTSFEPNRGREDRKIRTTAPAMFKRALGRRS